VTALRILHATLRDPLVRRTVCVISYWNSYCSSIPVLYGN